MNIEMIAEVTKPNGEIDIWEHCEDVSFMTSGGLAIKQIIDWPNDDMPTKAVYAAGAWTFVEMHYELKEDGDAEANV